MGYSCTVRAAIAQEAALAGMTPDERGTSNGFTYKGASYFIERGREHNDGSITASIFRNLADGEHCRRVASLKIDKGGKIIRPAYLRKAANNGGFAKIADRYRAVDRDIHGREFSSPLYVEFHAARCENA